VERSSTLDLAHKEGFGSESSERRKGETRVPSDGGRGDRSRRNALLWRGKEKKKGAHLRIDSGLYLQKLLKKKGQGGRL